MTNGPYKCDECGNTNAIQSVTQHEFVTADENGEPENIDVDEIEVNFAECADCGNQLID